MERKLKAPGNMVALALVAMLLAAAPARAAERKGCKVLLQLTNGTVLTGELLAVKGETLVVRTDSGAGAEAAMGDVFRLAIRPRDRVGKGLGRGMLIGVLAGGLLAVPLSLSKQNEYGGAFIVCGAGIGLGIGAILGGFSGVSTRQWNYEYPEGPREEWRAKTLARLKKLARFSEEQGAEAKSGNE